MPFERENHVVNGRWRDLEEPLKIGFGRSAPIQFHVRHNEGQVLTLKSCELIFQGSSLSAVTLFAVISTTTFQPRRLSMPSAADGCKRWLDGSRASARYNQLQLRFNQVADLRAGGRIPERRAVERHFHGLYTAT